MTSATIACLGDCAAPPRQARQAGGPKGTRWPLARNPRPGRPATSGPPSPTPAAPNRHRIHRPPGPSTADRLSTGLSTNSSVWVPQRPPRTSLSPHRHPCAILRRGELCSRNEQVVGSIPTGGSMLHRPSELRLRLRRRSNRTLRSGSLSNALSNSRGSSSPHASTDTAGEDKHGLDLSGGPGRRWTVTQRTGHSGRRRQRTAPRAVARPAGAFVGM